MHLRCPLRPLTEAGRVLLCVAAALFAALLLVSWTAVPMDEEGPELTLTSAPAVR